MVASLSANAAEEGLGVRSVKKGGGARTVPTSVARGVKAEDVAPLLAQVPPTMLQLGQGEKGKPLTHRKENRPSTDSSRSAATKRSTDGDRTAPLDALPISTLAAPKGSARERILPASFSSPTDVSPVTLKSPPSFSSSSTKAPPETPVDWDDPAFVRPGACPGEQYALAVMFFKFSTFAVTMAICASGSTMHITTSLAKDVSQWYYHQACALMLQALEAPSLETFQSLLIMIEVASAIGLRSTWWGIIRMVVTLSITLGLNIDPDLLPDGILQEGTWLEKETRRRCWWASYLVERTLAVTFYQPPLISKTMCSVKPVCADSVWFSPKDPAKLEQLYSTSQGPRVNLLTFRVQLSDITTNIILCATPEPLFPMDVDTIVATEKRLEQELDDYKQSCPPEFGLQLTEEWVYETMDTDHFQFHSMINHFIGYHGSRCYLMRRRALVHLREVSASLSGSRLTPDEENSMALQKGLSSAVAIAKLLGILLKSPGAIQRYPLFLALPTVQGCMMLIMADGLFPAFTRSPNTDSRSPTSNTDFDPADTPAHIDCYLRLLRTVGVRNAAIRNLVAVLEQFRRSEWSEIERLCEDPGKLTSVDIIKDDDDGADDRDKSNGDDDDGGDEGGPRMSNGGRGGGGSAGPDGGAWDRRVRMLATSIRAFLSGIRTAREVSSRMSSPAPPPAASPWDPHGASASAASGGSQQQRPSQALQRPTSPARMLWLDMMQSQHGEASAADEMPGLEEGAWNSGGGSGSGGLWFDREAPMAENPDDGDNAMVLLDWLFSTDPLGA
ncbi:fungal-specific transcription factor domain-containing protein [Zopfochytrium polystomum]|nr:fungal-specific transcription factor domain-containing protein [Zopfochytrium polystomum]